MSIGLFIPCEVRFFSSRFELYLHLCVLRTFFGPWVLIQWQYLTFLESIFTPILLRTFNGRSSRFRFSVFSWSPVISKHSRLVYWLLAQHRRSKLVTILQGFDLTDLDIDSLDTNFLKLYFKSAMLARVELSFAWYSRVSAITSSSLILLRSASVSEWLD